MGSKYKVNDTAFFVESNNTIREVRIVKYSGGLYTIRFTSGGGIKVRESRLFETKDEAETSIQKPKSKPKSEAKPPLQYPSPWEWSH